MIIRTENGGLLVVNGPEVKRAHAAWYERIPERLETLDARKVRPNASASPDPRTAD